MGCLATDRWKRPPTQHDVTTAGVTEQGPRRTHIAYPVLVRSSRRARLVNRLQLEVPTLSNVVEAKDERVDMAVSESVYIDRYSSGIRVGNPGLNC
jgi:hypothetical protein